MTSLMDHEKVYQIYKHILWVHYVNIVKIDENKSLVPSLAERRRLLRCELVIIMEVAVLFSETIEWALAVGLISPRQLSDRDPLLFVALPRIAVFVGCLLLPNSPIGPNRLNSGAKPPFMFAESTRDLVYLSRQLPVLRADQLWRLACWTSPFGLSEKETKYVDAATSATLSTTTEILIGGKSKLGITPKTPSSLVLGWNTYGLHCMYKCISRVAGNLFTHHPSEYRDILQIVLETSIYGHNYCGWSSDRNFNSEHLYNQTATRKATIHFKMSTIINRCTSKDYRDICMKILYYSLFTTTLRVSDNNRLNSLLDAARRLILEFPSHRAVTFEELAQWIPLGNLAAKIRRQPILGY
ncbi:hypothetical protein ACTXT7_007694 [Hymenolepis weldensis]